MLGPRGGYLIPPHSLEKLVEGIEAYLAAPARFTQMAEHAHARILEEFAFDLRTERLMRFYEKLCGRDAAA